MDNIWNFLASNAREVISIACVLAIIALVLVIPLGVSCGPDALGAISPNLDKCRLLLYQGVGVLVIILMMANFIRDEVFDYIIKR